jgi:hypothetical protein
LAKPHPLSSPQHLPHSFMPLKWVVVCLSCAGGLVYDLNQPVKDLPWTKLGF